MANTRLLLQLPLRPPAPLDIELMERDVCNVLADKYSAERLDLLSLAATAIEDASYLDCAALARIGAAMRDLDTLMVARDVEHSANIRTIGQLHELLEASHYELLAARDAHQVTTMDLEAAHADLREERRAHADSRLQLVAEQSRHQATTDLLTAERAETVRLRGHAARLSGENAQLRLTDALEAATGIGHRTADEVAIDIEEADRSHREMNRWLLERRRSEAEHFSDYDCRRQGHDFADDFTDVDDMDECGFNLTAVDEEMLFSEYALLEPGCPQRPLIIPAALTSFGEEP